MAEKTPDPKEILVAVSGNWPMITLLAFIAGAVLVTATFVVLARVLPDDITEGLTDA